MSERMSLALIDLSWQVAAIGLAVALVAIVLIIFLLGFFTKSKSNPNNQEFLLDTKAVESQSETYQVNNIENDDLEIIAVISVAISEFLGVPQDSFRIKTIKKVKVNNNLIDPWRAAGILENTKTFC